LLFLLLLCTPSISTCTFIFCTSTTPVFNCEIVIILPLRPIYCLTSLIYVICTNAVYRLFYCVVDCTFVYSMCNSVLCVSHCLALSGRSCKWELILNWSTWLSIGEIKK
jgi:hypothetical protein